MQAGMKRMDKGGLNEVWAIEIGEQLVTLITPTGQAFLKIDPVTAPDCIEFPSFSKSIKYTSFKTSQGVFTFAMEPATLKQLRTFANGGIAAKGPEAVQAILRNALLTTAGGVALLCLGVFLLISTVKDMMNHTQGSGRPAGLISTIFGFAILCRGIYGLYQYKQLKNHMRK